MKERLSPKLLATFRTLGVLLLVFAIWMVWGNKTLMVSTITVSSGRIPAAFDGFRIAQVSDLHNAEFGKDNTVLLRMLSESTPDIIVITGDLVDAQHTDIEIALDFSKKAVQIAPVYYVTGNHEASLSRYEEMKSELKVAGVVVLEDERLEYEYNGDEIMLIGLSDPNFAGYSGIYGDTVSAKLNSLFDGGKGYTVVLSHRPELFKTYVDCGVDLILSGHAHGGQFRLPFVGGLIAPNQGLFPQYDAGLYTDGGTNMVVSRGLGNSVIPVRFNNRPEIVLVELKATQ